MGWFWIALWVVLGFILLAVCVLGYLFYRQYKKIQAVQSFAMPSIPFQNMLGHPDGMLHPCKHLLRAQICDSIDSAYYQLLLTKAFMVFVNDAVEAGKIMTDLVTKGGVYRSFRWNPKVADTMSAEGPAWEARIKTLKEAYAGLKCKEGSMTTALLASLRTAAESGKSINIASLFSLYALDVMSEAAFGYELGAVAGSAEGKELLLYLDTNAAYLKHTSASRFQMMKISFPLWAALPAVSAEAEAKTKEAWGRYLAKMQALVVAEALQHEKANGELRRNVLGDALVSLARQMHATEVAAAAAAGTGAVRPLNLSEDPNICAELHQVLRHGHDCLSAQLQWLFYTLHRRPEERAAVERDLAASSNGAQGVLPPRVEAVLLEVMRMRPAASNFTVRTIEQPYRAKGPNGGYLVPVQEDQGFGPGTPVNVSIYSLQNTRRTWGPKSKDDPWHTESFQPERWLDASQHPEGAGSAASHPSCPFLARNPALASAPSPHNVLYGGVGFKSQSLSFFPFSAGDRRCRGIDLALSVLRRTLLDVVPAFRLDALKADLPEDPGASHFTTVVPVLTMEGQSSVDLAVTRVTEAGVVPKKKKEAHGWAQDDSDDEAGKEGEGQ